MILKMDTAVNLIDECYENPEILLAQINADGLRERINLLCGLVIHQLAVQLARKEMQYILTEERGL